ncbi:SurA N-terminal domain-containing protein [Pseudomonas sp. NPDC089554]|uniref:SurA N-terminal domain-containing protein n=1 Tax=Pseudomonas sp. NPDC089554 TaxID=3390653 RepID=UPI003D079E8F
MRTLLLCMLLVAQAQAAELAAARVNGVEISVLRLERYFSEYLQAQGRALSSIRNPNLYKRLRDEALDELIDKELLWQEARRQGVEISDAQVAVYVAELEQAFASPAAFERALAEAGFDRPRFADYTRHEMAAQQAYARLTRIDEPSQAQVEALRQQLEKMPNQSDNALVSGEQGLALAKSMLVGQLQAQARQSVRQRLREGAVVERAN